MDRAAGPEAFSPRVADRGFVGSAACSECHADVVSKYQSHPMAHSSGELSRLDRIETDEGLPVRSKKGLAYSVGETAGRMFHREQLLSVEGKVLYDQSVPIQYAIGSGRRGRSYLVQRGATLVMSPLTWYSQRGRWDLSPGYEKSRRHFDRRLTDGCLQCHVGRVAAGEQRDTVSSKVFHEASIGCERCHGPGEEHVVWYREHGTSSRMPHDPIVNPSTLTPELREEVCNQCHLQGVERVTRRGRSDYDFRPGQSLADTWVIFEGSGTEESTNAVHQVPQMRSSGCFLGSAGKLGCVSCHDPHAVPSIGEEVAFYRERCLACHAVPGVSCALDESARIERQADDSCIACHMPKLAVGDVPHTAQTDHTIPRLPREKAVGKSKSPTFELWPGMADRVPARDIERARGLLMARFAVELNDVQLGIAATVQLEELADYETDVDVVTSLAELYQLQGRPDVAGQNWRHVLALRPNDEFATRNLGFLAHDAGDDEFAERYLRKAIEINAWDRVAMGRLVHVLGRVGQVEEARRLAEELVRSYPWDTQVQNWLEQYYREHGQDREADDRREIIDRLNP